MDIMALISKAIDEPGSRERILLRLEAAFMDDTGPCPYCGRKRHYLSRKDDHDTSKEAATKQPRKVTPSTNAGKMLKVWAYHGEMTDGEAMVMAGLPESTGAWHRGFDLRRDGYITLTGTKRPNHNGNKANVSIITEAGLAKVRSWG
jgi:hypothetical protein